MALAGGIALPAAAQEAIGHATSVTPQADSSGRVLSPGVNVHSQETVRTGDSGLADLQFRDDSKLSVGSKSNVRLDKFVFDPNKSTGAIAIQATRGSFRFATGAHSTMKVKTPYGALGIRG